MFLSNMYLNIIIKNAQKRMQGLLFVIFSTFVFSLDFFFIIVNWLEIINQNVWFDITLLQNLIILQDRLKNNR